MKNNPIVKWLHQHLLNPFRRFPVAYAMLGYLYVATAFCYYPVSKHWLSAFIMMSLPLAMFAGALASIHLFRKGQKTVAAAGLVWLVCSLLVVKRLVGTPDTTMVWQNSRPLKVLSYNSETLPVSTVTTGRKSWLDVDIACFQEFTPSSEATWQFIDGVLQLSDFGAGRKAGLALFSKYPIIAQYGRIWHRTQGPDINGFICADIAYGADTIRVVNVHLWSMGIRTSQAVEALREGQLSYFWSEMVDTFHRMKEGFEYRNEQLLEVETYVAGSRYPVIICGDFNEMPIGFSYGKLRQNFRNAFEEAGQGLGFTLNRHPYCVRIDQQFVSSDWIVRKCEVLSHIEVSDHFPVVAQYALAAR